MQLVINIEKKHFIILVALISLLGIFIIGSAEDVSQDLPYHYLQQVSKSNSDMTSVDSNENKIIDEAENLSASGDSHVLNNLIMHAGLDMDGNNINNINKIGDVDSTDMVTNLNADMVDGQQWSDIQNWVNSNDDYLPQNPAPNNVDMNGNKITNLDSPDNNQDAATKYYVDNNGANFNACRICVRVYNDNNADTECVDFNDGWTNWAGSWCGGSGCGEGTMVRVRVDC